MLKSSIVQTSGSCGWQALFYSGFVPISLPVKIEFLTHTEIFPLFVIVMSESDASATHRSHLVFGLGALYIFAEDKAGPSILSLIASFSTLWITATKLDLLRKSTSGPGIEVEAGVRPRRSRGKPRHN